MNKKGFGRFGKGSAMLTSALVMGNSLGASATQESVANDSKIFFNNYIKPFMSHNEIFKDIYDNEKNESLNNNEFSLFSRDNQDVVNKGIIDINEVDEDGHFENDNNFSLFSNNDDDEFTLLNDEDNKAKEKQQDNGKNLSENKRFDNDDNFSLFSNNDDDEFTLLNDEDNKAKENQQDSKKFININKVDEDENLNNNSSQYYNINEI